MTDRKAFEALDRTLRDIQSAHNLEAAALPFGGKVVVLGGDLRQILPVIKGGSRSEIVGSAIINSSLWSAVEVLNLTQNMRLASCTGNPAYQKELEEFSNWVLAVGEGRIPSVAKEGETEPSWIKIPNDLLLMTEGDKMACIVGAVYQDLEQNRYNTSYLAQRAVLTPTNELVVTVHRQTIEEAKFSRIEPMPAPSIAGPVSPLEA